MIFCIKEIFCFFFILGRSVETEKIDKWEWWYVGDKLSE